MKFFPEILGFGVVRFVYRIVTTTAADKCIIIDGAIRKK